MDPAERKRLLEQIKTRQAEHATDRRATVMGPQPQRSQAGAASVAQHASDAPESPALSREYIQARVHELVPLVQECYESALHKQPTLHGRLTVRFVMEGEPGVAGVVSESEVLVGGLAESVELKTCVRETMYTLKFDPPAAGGKVTVEYPFLFDRAQGQSEDKQ
jgi:hypothetical protein